MKKIPIESDNESKSRSTTGKQTKLEDDAEKQMEMQLLDSTPSQPSKSKPSKESVSRK